MLPRPTSLPLLLDAHATALQLAGFGCLVIVMLMHICEPLAPGVLCSLRDPGTSVPLSFEAPDGLLRRLPQFKGTHAHTVQPNLIDGGWIQVGRIPGPAKLFEQDATFLKVGNRGHLHGIASRVDPLEVLRIRRRSATADFS
jgi:hypothetical protein